MSGMSAPFPPAVDIAFVRSSQHKAPWGSERRSTGGGPITQESPAVHRTPENECRRLLKLTPGVIDPAKLAYAVHLRDQKDKSISEIVEATGITRSSLYRYLPLRPPETLTAESQQNA